MIIKSAEIVWFSSNCKLVGLTVFRIYERIEKEPFLRHRRAMYLAASYSIYPNPVSNEVTGTEGVCSRILIHVMRAQEKRVLKNLTPFFWQYRLSYPLSYSETPFLRALTSLEFDTVWNQTAFREESAVCAIDRPRSLEICWHNNFPLCSCIPLTFETHVRLRHHFAVLRFCGIVEQRTCAVDRTERQDSNLFQPNRIYTDARERTLRQHFRAIR